MLRKRIRSINKEQQMGQMTSDGGSESHLRSDFFGQEKKTNSFFNVHGLFVGLTPKCSSDCDSVRSPSPLDFKLFSNLGNSFRFPYVSEDGHQRSLDCHKVGLGIVDSLDVDDRKISGKILGSSSSKSILFGPQIRAKPSNSPTNFNLCESPKSLPRDCAIFPHTHIKSSNLRKCKSNLLIQIGEDHLEFDPFGQIQSFSLDSKRLGSLIYSLADLKADSTKNSCLENATVEANSLSKLDGGLPNFDNFSQNKLRSNGFILSPSAREIELSEDYTCVISHGPTSKTTHIFRDCILECHTKETDCGNKRGGVEIGIPKLGKCSEFFTSYPSDDFSSFCYFYKNKLEEGNDTCLGEKPCCSLDCHSEKRLIEKRTKKSTREALEDLESKTVEENFEIGTFIST